MNDYVAGIIYFVLDFVEVLDETRLIEPMMYKFKSRELYYPLKTSNTFGGSGLIEWIILAPSTLFKPGPLPDFKDLADTTFADRNLRMGFPLQASNSALIVSEEADIAGICPEGESF